MRHAKRNGATVPAGSFSAEIHDLDHEGRGIARVEGKVVFIADALPGETVRFRYTRRARDIDEGQLLEIRQASPDRIEPACPHFGVCGGCALQHLAAPAQVRFKQQSLIQALARIGKVQPDEVAEPIVGEPWGYRRRARLGVRWHANRRRVVLGFRERATPNLTDIRSCPVLDQRVSDRLPDLAELIASLDIKDQVAHVEVAAAEQVHLVFRVLRAPEIPDQERLLAFAGQHQLRIWLQPGEQDSLRELTDGPAPTFAPIEGAPPLEFLPTDFVQVNGRISQRAVAQAMDWLALVEGESVLELFSGVGNFTLPMLMRGVRVTAVEGEASLVRRARENLQRLGQGERAQLYQDDLFKPAPKAPWQRQRPDAVLLDPPRAGAQEMMPLIGKLRPSRVLYVSCHPGTLARDIGQLVGQQGYRLVRIGIMDMFPHTAHVESMALLVRAEKV